MKKDRTAGNSDWYLQIFNEIEKNLNGAGKQKIHQIRKNAISHLHQSGFPTTKDEEWKYTDIRPITAVNFDFSNKSEIPDSAIEQFKIKGLDSYQLIFINGNFRRDISSLGEESDHIQIISLQDYLDKNNGDPGTSLTQFDPSKLDTFSSLNTAFINDGVVILVAKNAVIDKPVHIIHINDGEGNTITTPRNLFRVEQGAQVKIVESFCGLGNEQYFTNAVTEVEIQANASLEHFKIQTENSEAYHINSVYVKQQRDSNFVSHNCTFGGKLVRNNFNIKLNGEGTNSVLNGLYLGSDNQHIDNHTTMDHAKPHCQSDELYKGILDGHARGVFNGKIFVRQDAQKTNAIQNNNTILLSDNATIDTKPQLEIFADDVRCTHGATVGQLNEDADFYLRSRGIDRQKARQLLIFAFASDVIDRVQIEPIRDRLADLLADKLHTIRPE
jgi:Fe-S cluster assembly protein SufD